MGDLFFEPGPLINISGTPIILYWIKMVLWHIEENPNIIGLGSNMNYKMIQLICISQ